MATARPPAPVVLARRYRRLLVAYPAEYRRRRGAEIVDTLLDLAPDGRRRPAVSEAVNLLACGLRARLGRPRSRLVVALSALTAVMAGTFGSVAGFALAWQTAGPLPSNARAHEIVRTAIGGRVSHPSIRRDDHVFAQHDDQPLAMRKPTAFRFDRYRAGAVELEGVGPSAAGSAQDRLRARGWRIGRRLVIHTRECRNSGACDQPAFGTATMFSARKGSVALRVQLNRGDGFASDSEGSHPATGDPARVLVEYYRATPGLVLPAEIIGALLAGGLAWLLFGWISRRTQRRSRGTRLATTLLYLGCTVTLLPTAVLIAVAYGYGIVTGSPLPHEQWLPAVTLLDAVTATPRLMQVGAVLAVLLVALAVAGAERARDAAPAGRPVTVRPAEDVTDPTS